MKVLKACPCFYNKKYSYLYSKNLEDIYEEEDSDDDYSLLSSRSYQVNVNTYNLINTSSVDSLKNNWEWLCLKYERRLNEILNIVKNTNSNINSKINNNGNNKLGSSDADVGMFLSFVPNILQDYIRNLIISNKIAHKRINKDKVDNTSNTTDRSNKDTDNDEAEDEEIDNGEKEYLDSGLHLECEDLESLVSNKLIDKKGVMLMFCDISGFTSITNIIEKKNNSKYVANLGQFLNNFFNPLINIIHYYNGDIIKFSGDAILTIFYPHSNSNNYYTSNTTDRSDKDNENLVKMALNCLKCCEELHNILNNYPIVLYNNSASSLVSSVKKGNESPVSSRSNNTTDRSNKDDTSKVDFSKDRVNEENDGEVMNLKLHISCTFGDIKMKIVGGIFERYEYYLNGTPLTELSEINNISKSDETLVSGNLYNIVKNYIDSIPVESNSNSGKYYHKFVSFKSDVQVDGMISRMNSKNLSLRENDLYNDFGEKKMIYMKLLSYFIPKYIYKKLMYNVNIYNNEIRRITIIFVNFRILYNYSNKVDGSRKSDENNTGSNASSGNRGSNSSSTDKTSTTTSNNNVVDNKDKTSYLNNLLVEVIMKICQKSIYSFEGTLNKLLIDDKGLSFLIFMGFPPFFSEDYTFKSVLLSMNIYNNINKYNLNNNLLISHQFGNRSDNTTSNDNMNSVNCDESKEENMDRDRLIETLSNVKYKINIGIGISTGNVWCGILGNDVRREYTAIGDVVNVSCRLMDYSQKLSEAANKGTEVSDRYKNKNEYYTDNVMMAVRKNDGNTSNNEEENENNTNLDGENNEADFNNDNDVNEDESTGDEGDFDMNLEESNEEENVKIIKENDIKYNIIMDINTYKECSKYIEIIKLNPVKLKNKKGMFDVYTTNCRLIFNHFNHSDVTGELVGRLDGDLDDDDELECKNSDLNVLDSLFDGERLLNEMLRMMRNNNVIYLEHNDSNGNALLYGYIRQLIGRYFYKDKTFNGEEVMLDKKNVNAENDGDVNENKEFKVLGINYNIGGIGIENVNNAYKGLVNGIVGEWRKSSERSSNFSSEDSISNNDKNKDNKNNNYDGNDNKNVLKELLDPNLHWNMDVLGKLMEQNLSIDRNVFSENKKKEDYYRNSIVSLLLFGDNEDLTKSVTNFDLNNKKVEEVYDQKEENQVQQNKENSKNEGKNENRDAGNKQQEQQDFENRDADNSLEQHQKTNAASNLASDNLIENKDVDDYLYSLIEGLNLYHNLVLVVNVSNVDESNRLIGESAAGNNNLDEENNNRDVKKVGENKLLNKLIKYANNEKNKNKFMLLIIDGNFKKEQKEEYERMKLKKMDEKNIKNLLFEFVDNKLLEEGKQKQELLEQQNKDNFENNVVVDGINNKKLDELATVVYNNTNGIYYFVYLYFKYILNYVSSEENKIDELMKSLGNLYKNEITIYFKYKIDLLNNYELFVLKFLILLNHPITLNRLHEVIDFDAAKENNNRDAKIKQQEQQDFENRDAMKMILDRLIYHNLVTYEAAKENNNRDAKYKQQEQQISLNAAKENNKKYVVKNKILKEIVNDMIPSEEKLHIVNNYLIHF